MKTDLVVAGYIFSGDKVLLIYNRKLNKWLPVGGHIELNETPDSALIREIKEETNLDIDFFNKSSTGLIGNVKEDLAVPFCVNVHSVGDHDHCALFYICNAVNKENLKINNEIKDFMWLNSEELRNHGQVQEDVKAQALKAFEILNSKNE